MRIQKCLLGLLCLMSTSGVSLSRQKIVFYLEAGKEFRFNLVDYTKQKGTFQFDRDLDWGNLTKSGAFTLNPQAFHVGNHSLVLEVKKSEEASLFYDVEIEVKSVLDSYSFDLNLGKSFARFLPNLTGLTGKYSFDSAGPNWISLTEDGILFGTPDVGGKIEVLIRVVEGGKTAAFWVVLTVEPVSHFTASFVKLGPGMYDMGSPSGQSGHMYNEELHKVTLTKAFEIQTTEVTQAQWFGVMKTNPSRFQGEDNCPGQFRNIDGVGLCPKNPVENVSWDKVPSFLKRLNDLDRNYVYRLPTEAEWEFAARGNTQTVYSFGDNTMLLGEYAWFFNNSGRHSQPVATKKPNPFGLYDIHGNVREWVQDSYLEKLGSSGVIDPIILSENLVSAIYRLSTSDIVPVWPPLDMRRKVARGGGYESHERSLRSASRGALYAKDGCSDTGLRLVRVPR